MLLWLGPYPGGWGGHYSSLLNIGRATASHRWKGDVQNTESSKTEFQAFGLPLFYHALKSQFYMTSLILDILVDLAIPAWTVKKVVSGYELGLFKLTSNRNKTGVRR